MTDINIQELRHAAEFLDGDDWHVEGNSVYSSAYDVGDSVCYDLITSCESVNGKSPKAEFIAAANHAVLLALLDELEKLQRANAAQCDRINQQQDRIDGLELTNAGLGGLVSKLEKEVAQWVNIADAAAKDDAEWHKLANRDGDVICKLTDAMLKRISRAEAAEKRVAELEAELEKADRLYDSQYLAGMKAGWNFGVENDDDGFNKCVELRRKQYAAAGISKGE